MAQHADVLIVGGGVIGLTTAWYLAGEGVAVTLAERGEIGRQASWAGAGILPPADLGQARSPIDRLRAHSVRLYPGLSAQLREQTGIDNGYVACGGLELLDPDVPAALLPSEEWHGEGVPCERLDRAGLHRREPALAPDLDRGVWIPGVAQVRNPRHLKALQAGCAARGVRLLPGWPVERLVSDGSRIAAFEGPAGRLAAGQVLLAAGAWTAQLLRQAGRSPDIRPIRGQMVLFATGRPGVRPVLMQGKRYLVPRTDGRVLAGSTEEDVGFDARATGGGIAGLIAFATRLVPALAEATLETCWAGLRPGSPDEVPYLGRVPGWDNLHVASGHFRAGLQLSPATGLVMAQHLLGVPTLLPLEPFALDRPGAERA
jgi:glycine oxidase